MGTVEESSGVRSSRVGSGSTPESSAVGSPVQPRFAGWSSAVGSGRTRVWLLHVLTYMHMRRTSILLAPGLLAELERIGRRQNRPTAHVMREALEEYVAAQGEERRALPAFVGLGRATGGEAPDTTDDE